MSTRCPTLLGLGFCLGFAACTAEDSTLEPRGAEHEPEEKMCARTQGYWKTHSEFARQEHKQIEWPIDESTLLCGATWYDLLWTPPRGGNHWLILAHQWIAAMLNQASGVFVPPDVQDALDAAQMLLETCSELDAETASDLAGELDDFNNGAFDGDDCVSEPL